MSSSRSSMNFYSKVIPTWIVLTRYAEAWEDDMQLMMLILAWTCRSIFRTWDMCQFESINCDVFPSINCYVFPCKFTVKDLHLYFTILLCSAKEKWRITSRKSHFFYCIRCSISSVMWRNDYKAVNTAVAFFVQEFVDKTMYHGVIQLHIRLICVTASCRCQPKWYQFSLDDGNSICLCWNGDHWISCTTDGNLCQRFSSSRQLQVNTMCIPTFYFQFVSWDRIDSAVIMLMSN